MGRVAASCSCCRGRSFMLPSQNVRTLVEHFSLKADDLLSFSFCGMEEKEETLIVDLNMTVEHGAAVDPKASKAPKRLAAAVGPPGGGGKRAKRSTDSEVEVAAAAATELPSNASAAAKDDSVYRRTKEYEIRGSFFRDDGSDRGKIAHLVLCPGRTAKVCNNYVGHSGECSVVCDRFFSCTDRFLYDFWAEQPDATDTPPGTTRQNWEERKFVDNTIAKFVHEITHEVGAVFLPVFSFRV